MITEFLLQSDQSLILHNEAEWNNGPESEYSAFNSGGVESEVGEFLYGMLRMMKPENILETGTHHGVGASYMGQALKDNGKGKLTTIEYIKENYDTAKFRINKLQLNDFVNILLQDVKDYTPNKMLDFVFLDTEPHTRFRELLQFYPYVKEGGYIFIHDLGRHLQQIQIPGQEFAWPFGIIPNEMREMLRFRKLVPFYFTTPRGISCFYKPSHEDYEL